MIANESQVRASYQQLFYVFQTPALIYHDHSVYMPGITC